MMIVVVSENRKILEKVKKTMNGYEVIGCIGLLEGVGELLSVKGNEMVVIADYELKISNGVELLKSVKKMKGVVHTVLMISDGNEEGEIEGLRNEIDLMIKHDESELITRLYIEKLLNARVKREIIRDNKIIINDAEIELTRKEMEIVALLLDNKGVTLRRTEISQAIWGSSENVRKIDIHVKSIRKKLEGGNLFNFIVTIHGVGYRWNDSCLHFD